MRARINPEISPEPQKTVLGPNAPILPPFYHLVRILSFPDNGRRYLNALY
jgi:hypothetical protein